jgi:predicted DNA-binding protein with PD1-like motif
MNRLQRLLLSVVGLILSGTMTRAEAQQENPGAAGYISPTAPVATGKAPGMKVGLLSETGAVKNYAIVLAKGDEVMSGLTDFARKYQVKSASFTAIGAFSGATVAWFDEGRKEFKLIPLHEQMELVSMIGDIALSGDQPVVHTHVSLAASDGSVRGGHLIEANVFPTLELFMTVYLTPLHKEPEQETGLKLIDPALK